MNHRQQGFTLVELLMAVTVLGIIAAPLSIGVITGARFLGQSDQRLTDSRSVLVAAAYFAGDVAGANTVVKNDAAACGGGTAVVSLDSSNATDGVGGALNNEVSYVYDTTIPTNFVLSRRACLSGVVTAKSNAAVSLGSTPVVTCYDAANVVDATCATVQWAKMVVTQKVNKASATNPTPTAYTFTLEGTLRPQ